MKFIIKKETSITQKNNNIKLRFSKIIWIILLSYGVFYGVITSGQQNGKLLIQYELSTAYDTAKVSMYLGVIVAISRISRLIGSIIFGKVYYKIKDKALLILTPMLFSSFLFIVIGYFIKFALLKFILMATGFSMILAVRDPFRLYTIDTILKLSKPEEQQEAVSYVQLSRKAGTTICTLLVSAALLKWEIIYVIIGIGVLAIMEVFIAMRLYSMLNFIHNSETKINDVKREETINDNIYN